MTKKKNLLSWYSRLRIVIQNEKISSFSSEVSIEVSSLSPFYCGAFQVCLLSTCITCFLFNAVNNFAMLGKNTDVST